MTKQPEYFVIAGPNGAGKSTHGHLFVTPGIEIFNGDLELAKLQKKYPLVELIRLQGGVASLLENARNEALHQKKNFAFETNYSTDMASEITGMFKNAGYHTTLIYFGLDNIKQSMFRVEQRVIDGGHNVSNEVIKFNFDENAKRINNDLSLFDVVVFADTQKQRINLLSVADYKQNLLYANNENVKWYLHNFKLDVERPDLRQTKKVNDILPRRRRRLRM